MRINDPHTKDSYLKYFGDQITPAELEERKVLMRNEATALISIMQSFDENNSQMIDMVELLSNAHSKLNHLLANTAFQELLPGWYGNYQRNPQWCINFDTGEQFHIALMKKYQNQYIDCRNRQKIIVSMTPPSFFEKIFYYPLYKEIKKSECVYKEYETNAQIYLKYLQYEKSFWDNMLGILNDVVLNY